MVINRGLARAFAHTAWTSAIVGGLLLALPALPRPLGATAAAHSQLVSSIPGAGEEITAAPTQLRLQFSESIAPGFTSFDLLDGTGMTLLLGAGTVDPTDDHRLIGGLPELAPGTYTVDWRALSAADGHVTEGAFTFAVTVGASPAPGASAGDGSLPPPVQRSDTIHVGHDATQAAVEVQGKVLAYGGVMLGFGLPVVAWFVIRPALGGRLPRAFLLAGGVAHLAVALGVGLLIVVSVASLPSAGATVARPDAAQFLTSTRPGQLLVARLALAIVVGVVAIALARTGRGGQALAASVGGAALGIGLLAISGHAAAFDSPVPVLVDLTHVSAGAIWLSGLVCLAVLSDFGGRFDPPSVRAILPRFSAVAIVSVGLVSATGVYADWTQTREIVSAATPYSINLDVKILFVLAALGVGALNFLDGGRDRRWLGGLSRRVLIELGVAAGVVVVTSNLTSGSPSWENRPIAIAPAPSTGRRRRSTSPFNLVAQARTGSSPRPAANLPRPVRRSRSSSSASTPGAGRRASRCAAQRVRREGSSTRRTEACSWRTARGTRR